jgi:hypothetical protein
MPCAQSDPLPLAVLRGLTFELRGRNRNGAWPAKRMMDSERFAGQVPFRWRSPLERRVRHQWARLAFLLGENRISAEGPVAMPALSG